MSTQSASSTDETADTSVQNAGSSEPLPSAGFLRRIAAMVYDLFPVIALAFITSLLFLPLLHGRRFIPEEVGMLAYVHWAIVLLVIAGFFVFFWVRKGQTLGMVVWRMHIRRADGSPIGWQQAVLRVSIVGMLWVPFFVGYPLWWGHWSDPLARKVAIAVSLLPLVLAYAWIWIDKEKLALPDRWTGTRIVVTKKKKDQKSPVASQE